MSEFEPAQLRLPDAEVYERDNEAARQAFGAETIELAIADARTFALEGILYVVRRDDSIKLLNVLMGHRQEPQSMPMLKDREVSKDTKGQFNVTVLRSALSGFKDVEVPGSGSLIEQRNIKSPKRRELWLNPRIVLTDRRGQWSEDELGSAEMAGAKQRRSIQPAKKGPLSPYERGVPPTYRGAETPDQERPWTQYRQTEVIDRKTLPGQLHHFWISGDSMPCFARPPKSFDLVRQIIKQAKADLWGTEGIDPKDIAQRMDAYLKYIDALEREVQRQRYSRTISEKQTGWVNAERIIDIYSLIDAPETA